MAEPLGEARMDLGANLDPLKKDLQEAKAVVEQKAKEIEQSVKVNTTGPDSPVASVEAVKVKTEEVKQEADKAGQSFRAWVGPAGAAVAAVNQLYTGIKQMQDASRKLGEELRAINEAFAGISKVQLDATTEAVQATQRLAEAQKKMVADEVESRNLIQDFAEWMSDGATEAVKLQQIENARVSTLARITQNEKDAAEAKREQAREAINLELTEGRIAFNRALMEQRRAAEIKAEEDLLKLAQERAELQEKMVADAKKQAEQMARAFESAFDRIRQSQASAFNSNNSEVLLSQLSAQIDTLISATRNIGGG